MKKSGVFIVVWIVFFTTLQAQTIAPPDSGIHFKEDLGWEGIKAAALARNKYIFIDAGTTWCSPCVYMEKKVFPLAQTGAFFNTNFISVRLQLDTTAGDTEKVRTWYADASAIARQYNIQLYPTFLFLAPNGEIVHKGVGASDRTSFIELGREALDPARQFYTLRKRYLQGDRDTTLLLALAKAARRAAEDSLALVVSKQYLSTQKNLFTRNNLMLLRASVTKPLDPYFSVFYKQPVRVDALLGKGESLFFVQELLSVTTLQPLLFSDGAPLEKPDWKAVEQKLGSVLKGASPAFIKELLKLLQANHINLLKGLNTKH